MKLLKHSQLALVMALGLSTVFSINSFAAQLSEDGAEEEPEVVNTAQLQPLPDLPPEIWCHIFSKLQQNRDKLNAGQVCKYWKPLADKSVTVLDLNGKREDDNIIFRDLSNIDIQEILNRHQYLEEIQLTFVENLSFEQGFGARLKLILFKLEPISSLLNDCPKLKILDVQAKVTPSTIFTAEQIEQNPLLTEMDFIELTLKKI